ncbi:MAG: serine/threonine protein kinase, partial [Ardenticatenales bacterium]|nr:serine/threonine protein kinase [Ardenticatenales bacterium]
MTEPGTILKERYRLERLLGEGGTAQVWLATDERMGRQVAIKILRPQYAKDEGLLERFRREARIVAHLDSPYIVQVYDVEMSEGISFIVMEYIDGQDLKELIRFEGAMPPQRALSLLRDIAMGVAVAHEAGLIHRDLKPGNVLISKQGEVKVTDFGIARDMAGAGLTEPGKVWGTSHYIAPEQAMGRPLTPAADIYSLGVLLFELLTGKLPFPGDDPVAVAIAHIQEPPPDIQTLKPSLPAGVARLVSRMMSKAPEQRPQTARALVEIVTRFLEDSGDVTT